MRSRQCTPWSIVLQVWNRIKKWGPSPDIISGDAILKNKVSSLKWRCCLIFQDRISNGDGSLFSRIASLGDERKTRGSWRPFSGFMGSIISAGISGIFHLRLGISGIFQCCSKFWDLGFPFWQLGFWDFINLKSHFLDFLYKLSEIFGAMRHFFSSSRDLLYLLCRFNAGLDIPLMDQKRYRI